VAKYKVGLLTGSHPAEFLASASARRKNVFRSRSVSCTKNGLSFKKIRFLHIGWLWFLPVLDITDNLPQFHSQARSEALEALAIEGYRSGALTSFESQQLLGFETRYQLDGFLKAHNVWEHAYRVEDFDRDCKTLEGLEDKVRPVAERPA
jgi:hypothetical protein